MLEKTAFLLQVLQHNHSVGLEQIITAGLQVVFVLRYTVVIIVSLGKVISC